MVKAADPEAMKRALFGDDDAAPDDVVDEQSVADDEPEADAEVEDADADGDEEPEADEVEASTDDEATTDDEPAWFRKYVEQQEAREKELKEELAKLRRADPEPKVADDEPDEDLSVDDRVAKLEAELERRDEQARIEKLRSDAKAAASKYDDVEMEDVLRLMAYGGAETPAEAAKKIADKYEAVAKARADKYKQPEGGVKQPRRKAAPKSESKSKPRTLKDAKRGMAEWARKHL
jgi:hypothetical protein